MAVSAELMATNGFGQTSIRDVANASGLSLGGMYYYFKGKEDLLAQIQKRTFDRFLQTHVEPEKRENVGLQAVFNSLEVHQGFPDHLVADFQHIPGYSCSHAVICIVSALQ